MALTATQQARIAQFLATLDTGYRACADTLYTGDDTYKVVVGEVWRKGQGEPRSICVGRGLNFEESADLQEQASRYIWSLRTAAGEVI